MAFSILNGLSALGTGVAQFAGAAGLDLQKAQLANQSAILADQLATTRETALQGQRQTFQTGENVLNRTATAANQAEMIKAENARSAATIAAGLQRTGMESSAAMARTQAEINAPTQTEKLFKFLGINPDGSPKGGGASTGTTAVPSTTSGDASTVPSTSTTGSVPSPDAGTTAATSPIMNPLVSKALGLPSAGSAEATRYAIAQDVARDPEFKYKPGGQQAEEVERRVGLATGAGRPRFSFSAPVTMPDPDDPSKTVSGVNRQDTHKGTVDFVRTDTDPNRQGGMGNRAEVQQQRVASAATMAAEAAKNIMELPSGSSTGWLGGRVQGGSLMAAIKESLANSVTSQEVQSYNVMLSGITRNLSTIETAGLAPNAGFTKSMESVILKENDSEITKMRKMAEIRQIVEYGLQPALVNPRLPEVQKDQLRGVIGKIQDAIPFTHHDITVLDKSPNNTTMSDVMKAKGLGPGAATAGPPPPPADPAAREIGKTYSSSTGQRGIWRGTGWEPVQ